MFRQRSCWLLNMIDRRVCVCRISPVHTTSLLWPAKHYACLSPIKGSSLSKNPQCSTEALYKQSLPPPPSSLPFHIPTVLPLAVASRCLRGHAEKKGSMIGTFIEWEEICEALGNKHHQLLSADKQLVREGIRNQIEGESLSGCRDNSGEDLVNGACVSGFTEMECRDINFHLE